MRSENVNSGEGDEGNGGEDGYRAMVNDDGGEDDDGNGDDGSDAAGWKWW